MIFKNNNVFINLLFLDRGGKKTSGKRERGNQKILL